MRKSSDPYPWLDEDDPRRDMTDEEILYWYIDLRVTSHTQRKRRGNGPHSCLQESF